MLLNAADASDGYLRSVHSGRIDRNGERTSKGCMPLPPMPIVRAMALAILLAAGSMGTVSAQSLAALTDSRGQVAPAKPMSPARSAWLKARCGQLVAFFDRYAVSRGENSDGPRNHTRIGAVIECERTNYRTGIDTMAALLVRKAFVVPKPGAPAVEPEDLEAPDITDPTRPWYWF